MNKEEPYRQQAERLKQRIQKINETTEVDDQLPPREQLHRRKKKKFKLKLKYPVIRLLVLFFVLLPVIIFSAISYLDGKKVNHAETTTVSPVGYETINLDQSNDEEEKVQEERSRDTIEGTGDSKEPGEESDEPKQVNGSESSTASQPLSSPITEAKQDQNKTAETDKTKNQTNSKPKMRIIYHKVQPKETLYRIAMTYYHSPNGMAVIKDANRLSSDQVNAGQVLKIPVSN
ncbi:LysM peptidoglycan-binding domain-containing protein [Neobacillus kokaensis]|uniref:LysM domain-containing protein n=1 Tax=Neobacillus kokaensis TaxID=2759023 RepID=A0ABQ3N3D9_9BACI|nr:LysM peptidoglycan-binding domain-containing protein [Neobacillus kokaensis]GHH98152.1 hypothetical protein AM1BK_16950 [Neobacillus kokaensis]